MNFNLRCLTLRMSRNFSTAVANTVVKPRSNVYREKTAREVWLGDVAAYPVMATIALGIIFSLGTTVWAASTFKDARLTDSTRKSLFRGEYALEYQHPVRPKNH